MAYANIRTTIVTPGEALRAAAREVERLAAFNEVFNEFEFDSLKGEVEVETSMELNVENLVDAADEDVSRSELVSRIAKILGVEEVTPEQEDDLHDLLGEVVTSVSDVIKGRLEEVVPKKGKSGFVLATVDAASVAEGLGAALDSALDAATKELAAVERAAIARHNAEVRASAKVLPMVKPAVAEPTPAAPEAPAAAKKPRAPRKPKAKPAAPEAAAPEAAAPVTPVAGKHPVDVAEALAVLADDNATPEAIAAALAMLA